MINLNFYGMTLNKWKLIYKTSNKKNTKRCLKELNKWVKDKEMKSQDLEIKLN